MRNVNVLGLVFPSRHDACLTGLATHRSMGSVPFGGRYRLIDFVLANMVNAGVSKVGIATRDNYRSLMDHIGSGKAWDLDRKNGGIFFLPGNLPEAVYSGRLASFYGMRQFLIHSNEDYVLISDCNIVGNLDYQALIRQHIERGADVTVAFKVGAPPQKEDNLLVRADGTGRLTDISIGQGEQSGAFGIGLYVIGRELLLRLADEAYAHSWVSFERDVLQHRLSELRLFGYEVPEYIAPIYSLASYFEANMALLDPAVRQKIFLPGRRIYTKVRDCAPAVYGLHSEVTDSLVADGALVEGTVRRSVLFRDVKVGPGVVLENCILMQGSEVRADARLGYVICDKEVQVCDATSLQGVAHYPVYVKKGMRI